MSKDTEMAENESFSGSKKHYLFGALGKQRSIVRSMSKILMKKE
jgi:hypothetical protein